MINFDSEQDCFYQNDEIFGEAGATFEDDFSFRNDNSDLYIDEKGNINIKQNNTEQTIQDSTKTSSNTDKIIVVTKQRKSSKIKFKIKTNPILEEEINKIIINKMNINQEDKLKFLLDINPKDIRILKIKDELINDESKGEYIETTLNTQNFQKNLKSKKNFQFESILVESIILYKYRLNNQIIEIPVKNRKIKTIDEEVISNAASEDKTSSISGKIVELRNKEMIPFSLIDHLFLLFFHNLLLILPLMNHMLMLKIHHLFFLHYLKN